MSLIRWSPFFDQFEDVDKHFFSDLPALRADHGFVPALDVYETKDAVMVESSLAGVDPNEVDVSIRDGVLTIKGETEKKSEVEEKDYYRKEVRQGSFFRQVALPAPVVADKAEASFANGILKIRLPKRTAEKENAIKVNISK